METAVGAIHGHRAKKTGALKKTGLRARFFSYFSQPRWRKYRKGAMALVIIRPQAHG